MDNKHWKNRQTYYHNNHVISDYILVDEYIKEYDSEDYLVDDIIKYFTDETYTITYPAKSYAVGIIYAQLLKDYFDEDFYDVLNDNTLLYNNDKFFKPYKKSRSVYDKVIKEIDLTFYYPTTQVKESISYFEKEFLLDVYPMV